jgi:hypothetical protein
MTASKIEISRIIIKACGSSDKGSLTFIPKKEATTTGIDMMIVKAARNFITIFILLETIET